MAAAASRNSRSLTRVVAKIPTIIAVLKTASFGKFFMATAPLAIDDGISIAPGGLPDCPQMGSKRHFSVKICKDQSRETPKFDG